MSTDLNNILSAVLTFIDEAVTTEYIKSMSSKDPSDVTKLISMILDLRFQTDFTLISSPTEIQELYDRYRNRPVEESNIEIRTLLDIITYVKIIINDKEGLPSLNGRDSDPYLSYINRLTDLLTLHSKVDNSYTCQDESITNTLDRKVWRDLLEANPWLVAAVLIRLIPGYHIIDITSGKFNDKGDINETRNTD